MSGYANNMTKLINKIEGRMGLRHIPLPNEYSKDKCASEIIIPDTLVTFSRFYQRKIKYHVDASTPKKDGWFYIDEDKIGGMDVEVLGVLDLDWNSMTNRVYGAGYGNVDLFANPMFDPATLGLMQSMADINSMIDSGIYIEIEEPNRFKLVSSLDRDISGLLPDFDIYVLIKHSDNLTTISPTMMNIFEDLAQSDVALYLYNALKYYDGLETVYATLDLKLDDLKSIADNRPQIMDMLDEYHTSSSNSNQPMILTV
jgi:hypothetical protein